MKFLAVCLSILKTSFVFCLALIFMVLGVMFTTVIAQDAEYVGKVTVNHSLPSTVPLKVELTGLESSDVLQNLRIKVKNISDKPIYYLQFGLRTVDVKSSGTPINLSIEYGRSELREGASKSQNQSLKETDKPINPNETVILKISKNRVNIHKKNIEIGLYQKPVVYELVFIDLMQGDGTRFSKSGVISTKKKSKNIESESCSTLNSLSFFRAINFSLNPLFSPEDKGFNFLQQKQIQPQGGQYAPTCAEGCAFSHCERVGEYSIGGCPLPEDPDVEEPFLYVNWVYNTTDCGDNCKTLELITEDCQTEGYVTRRYEVTACGEIPPPPPEGCVKSGHGEGLGDEYEYECNDGVDNDCDALVDCQESRCKPTSYCSNACDLDGDGVQNPSCGGGDCDEQSSYRTSIPLKDAAGNLIQETDQVDCNDKRDNDCDGAIDYPNDDSCPAPTPTPTPTPTPDDGGGGGDDGGGGGDDGGGDDGGGDHCSVVTVPNNDCCPWDPYTLTCYACQDSVIVVCD